MNIDFLGVAVHTDWALIYTEEYKAFQTVYEDPQVLHKPVRVNYPSGIQSAWGVVVAYIIDPDLIYPYSGTGKPYQDAITLLEAISKHPLADAIRQYHTESLLGIPHTSP